MKYTLEAFGKRATRVGAAAFALAVVGAASPALATAHGKKTNEFAVFATCPFRTPEVGGCVSAKSSNGSSFTAGNVTVPLTRPITLNGGFIELESGEFVFVGAEGGSTLAPVRQIGPSLENDIEPSLLPQRLRGAYERDVAHGKTRVFATIELAGSPSSIYLNESNILEPEIVPGEGGKTGLGLPTKVKLTNGFLGPECYVGSNSEPIEIDLTAGKSGSLEGKIGNLSSNSSGSILTISEDTLVNGTYEAPEAVGCGKNGEADAALNAKLGLPSASGKNSAVIDGTLKQAGAEVVEEHLE